MKNKIVFISDLHLSKSEPQIEAAFLKLLNKIKSNTSQLYILGDWFDFWLRDSINIPQYPNLIKALVAAHKTGLEIFFMPGNRDFLLGKKFFHVSKVKLIPDPYHIQLAEKQVLLTHGDRLCTDDKSYQKFMSIVQHPVTKFVFKSIPQSFSKAIARWVKRRTNEVKATKEKYIMDINQDAADKIMTDIDILIHGHTHRPATHKSDNNFRFVTSDWSKEIKVVVFNGKDFNLIEENQI